LKFTFRYVEFDVLNQSRSSLYSVSEIPFSSELLSYVVS
jgi:hypothetical protein